MNANRSLISATVVAMTVATSSFAQIEMKPRPPRLQSKLEID
jgi:hypothetical protein